MICGLIGYLQLQLDMDFLHIMKNIFLVIKFSSLSIFNLKLDFWKLIFVDNKKC